MNRLILIGNGFDLAHGFKTSFKDFIDDYLEKCIASVIKSGKHEDGILCIKHRKHDLVSFSQDFESQFNNLTEKVNYFRKQPDWVFQINSELFETILDKHEKLKWVDLEMEFFDQLIKWKKDDSIWKITVTKTNSDLDFLRELLLSYLNRSTRTLTTNEPNMIFVSQFKEEIKKKELSSSISETNTIPDSLYFLNFNYTSTIDRYLNELGSNIQFNHSYIHGSLSGSIKPVFGFGDEINKEYKEFEDQRNNELFKHIKSFHYSLNEEYFNLIRFIDSQEYQVSIFGHSCGLSDRTMLNQIFEHPNCKSIKIFYHKISPTENDFLEKVYEIYRHFGNKGEARKKIVPFKISSPMPQNPIVL